MEATPTQIIQYFSGFKQNLVPLFQRPYTWAERQWKTLWEDAISFYGADPAETKAPESWLCFGCGSSKETILVPDKTITPFLSQMSVTAGQDRHYWHVVIQKRGERLIVRLLGGVDGPDLRPFVVPSAEKQGVFA